MTIQPGDLVCVQGGDGTLLEVRRSNKSATKVLCTWAVGKKRRAEWFKVGKLLVVKEAPRA